MDFSNWTTDGWLQFAQDHWVVIVVAIVAIFIVMRIVKTVVKWALVAAIIVAIVVYGGYSMDDLKAVGTELTSKVTNELKDEALSVMAGEASQAKYVDNGDGTYSVKTPNVELKGEPGAKEVNVKFRGVSLGTWKLEGAVQDLVTQARSAAK